MPETVGFSKKNGSGGIPVARNPKWDLRFETRRGKCNLEPKRAKTSQNEPKRAPVVGLASRTPKYPVKETETSGARFISLHCYFFTEMPVISTYVAVRCHRDGHYVSDRIGHTPLNG
jgi:hypothetical protein